MSDLGPVTRYDDLLSRLAAVAEARGAGVEPAHDFLHVRRVAANAARIARGEGARVEIAVAAATLHELFNYPKGHPDSPRSGEVCAEHAKVVLVEQACPDEMIEPISYAIRVHPFSRGIMPETLEAKVLQDADRLDAIGAIGIARCFASCADMKRPFYSVVDPFCETREPDDKQWGIDHFYKKLLRIPDVMHTKTAKDAAATRVAVMREYLRALESEVSAV